MLFLGNINYRNNIAGKLELLSTSGTYTAAEDELLLLLCGGVCVTDASSGTQTSFTIYINGKPNDYVQKTILDEYRDFVGRGSIATSIIMAKQGDYISISPYKPYGTYVTDIYKIEWLILLQIYE